MIHDFDETLKALLIQKVPIDSTAIDIQFDRPDPDWETKLTKPTINCFLYDIRENQELRSNERYLSRNGETGTQRKAPTRINLNYFITVWAIAEDTKTAEEHRLLGRILKTLLSHPILPTEVLQGEMQQQPLPLRAWIAQPESTPNAWDFWGAMDGRIKAGISYGVTVAVEPFSPVEVDLVTETVLTIEPK